MIIIIILVTGVAGNLTFINDGVNYTLKNEMVQVRENNSIHYETHISHIFLPPPNATVVKILNRLTNIYVYTDNDLEWLYKRFKLREVYHNSASIHALSMLLKIKICSYLLKL